MSLVPIFNDLSFYEDSNFQNNRFTKLKRTFEDNFGNDSKIDFFARSPGRVNIIGDHIDYNYFPVLPMAINNDVIAAIEITNDKEIIITNTDANFKRTTIQLPSGPKEIVKIDETFSWANYFKCGLIVAQKYLIEKNLLDGLKGMKITFDGNVPTGGGLSSSAAFCVTTALSILYANGLTQIPKSDLTKITVVSEHYVGLNNGGMDQCASIYGEMNKALLIQFRPEIKGTPFKFPLDDLVFVITNSLQVSNKAETGPVHYNLRVVEMAIGADMLSKKLQLENVLQDSNSKTSSLRSVMECNYGQWDDNDIERGIEELNKMIDLVEGNLNHDRYTVEQASKELNITTEEFTQKYLTKFPVRFDMLKIYQRAKHVYQESLRVLETLKLLKSPIENETTFLKSFGQLLNKSQYDLKNLCENSNEKLDRICEIALANGSFGSRITGAGWGGSLVHLTTTDKLNKLIEAFENDYYKVEFPNITEDELKEAILVSKPANGSSIVTTNFLQ
ncbi:unnamed protein product [Candida verbasci]|uniref:Galactokinase n=1 Tax=Candida verbasci TaxID=1227364 RepID=A0A9W4TWY5_9ASCO|nr:unnamed protein product [Candida verbasci]